MDMMVHTKPTKEELRGLFRYLKAEKAFGFLGRDLQTERGFLKYFTGDEVATMVFEIGGQCIGIMWLTSYETYGKCAWIHYAIAPRHKIAQVRNGKAFLDSVMDGPDYEMLFAVYDKNDKDSEHMCRLFGFQTFKEQRGKVYSLRK